MSCILCAHFYAKSFEEEDGNCCLYPNHIMVSKEHYCGQIVMRPTWSESMKSISPIRDAQNDRNKYWDMYNRERGERILLEKKVKELRCSLKTQTVKKPEVV